METMICEAIGNRNLLKFYYDGGVRIVEPHCYGETKTGKEVLRAYQVDGVSSTGRLGWKLFDLEKIDDLLLLNDFFDPQPDYYRNDKNMIRIFCQI